MNLKVQQNLEYKVMSMKQNSQKQKGVLKVNALRQVALKSATLLKEGIDNRKRKQLNIWLFCIDFPHTLTTQT